MYRKFLRFLLTIISRWENRLWKKLYVCDLKKPKEIAMAKKAQQVFSPRKRIKRKGRHSKKDKNDYRGQGRGK